MTFLMMFSVILLSMLMINLDDSIDSGNFSVRGYLPLIRKDCITHMHVHAVYVKEGLPFAQDLSLENSVDSFLCFRLALLHLVSYFFFLYLSPSLPLCMAFDSVLYYVNVSVSIDFPINLKQDIPFHRAAYDYSRADWDGLRDQLRDVPWEDIFKISASAAASEFCE